MEWEEEEEGKEKKKKDESWIHVDHQSNWGKINNYILKENQNQRKVEVKTNKGWTLQDRLNQFCSNGLEAQIGTHQTEESQDFFR